MDGVRERGRAACRRGANGCRAPSPALVDGVTDLTEVVEEEDVIVLSESSEESTQGESESGDDEEQSESGDDEEESESGDDEEESEEESHDEKGAGDEKKTEEADAARLKELQRVYGVTELPVYPGSTFSFTAYALPGEFGGVSIAGAAPNVLQEAM
jgi:hypothetical protein